jgi:hypothetical protein
MSSVKISGSSASAGAVELPWNSPTRSDLHPGRSNCSQRAGPVSTI